MALNVRHLDFFLSEDRILTTLAHTRDSELTTRHLVNESGGGTLAGNANVTLDGSLTADAEDVGNDVLKELVHVV